MTELPKLRQWETPILDTIRHQLLKLMDQAPVQILILLPTRRLEFEAKDLLVEVLGGPATATPDLWIYGTERRIRFKAQSPEDRDPGAAGGNVIGFGYTAADEFHGVKR